MAPTRLLPAAVFLLGACRPDFQELPPRLKPLLETLPARYRPLDRQDTLESFWAPDSLLADSMFQYTNAHRSQVLLRVWFVPASVAAAARLDTLHFRRPYFRPEEYDRAGYHWDFFSGRSADPDLTETADRVPVRLALSYSWRYMLLEYRRWSSADDSEPRYYDRNTYLMDYPFGAEAEARLSDSVAYIRVFPMLAHQPRPDTLYPYYAYSLPVRVLHKRIPFVADQPDTTRQALLRLSFRVLSHSPNQD
ncbi:hypothetical protein [Hymenobacter bucti]|uniref:Lipoprotein n=1 Tax=Hymenobacter bucti TaxID=1844114 RepID=A0ABW4R0V4_9BACT